MIKLLLMDVDGTLTDGKIYINDLGEAFKAFNVKDGLGIKLLQENNITPIIITGRNSKIVSNRAKELNITEIYQNVSKKNETIKLIKEKFKVNAEELAYIGDDINDLDAMQECCFKACPADANPNIKKICNFVSQFNGGNGAVREIIDYILDTNKNIH